MSATSEIGQRRTQIAGRRLVSGEATFSADVSLPGTLHLAIARSTLPHARIAGIDVTAAASAPGVVRVLTGAEAAALSDPIPHYLDPGPIGGKHADVRCLALEKVVYVGQPLVAVVANSPNNAKAAAALVEVDYEPLPHVLDADEALAPDAPTIYDGWADNVVVGLARTPATLTRLSQRPSTRCRARSRSSARRPRRWSHGPTSRAGIPSPLASPCMPPTQNPHTLRDMLSRSLRLRESQIRLIAPSVGGAFGSKMPSHPEETLVCVLSQLVNAPVKWVEDRAEALLVGGREQVHSFEVAFNGDGRVLGLRDAVVGTTGAAAATPGWAMILMAGLALPCGYAIQRCAITYTAVATNKAPWNAQRGFGKESANLAMERIMDAVARRLELDPALGPSPQPGRQ